MREDETKHVHSLTIRFGIDYRLLIWRPLLNVYLENWNANKIIGFVLNWSEQWNEFTRTHARTHEIIFIT